MFWDWDFFDELEAEDFAMVGGLWGLIEEEMEDEDRIRQDGDFLDDGEDYED